MASDPSETPGTERVLVLVIAMLVASFLVATVIVQRMSSDIQQLSGSLVDKAMPRIVHVATLRSSTLQVQLALSDFVRARGEAERREAEDSLDASLRELERAVAANSALATLPGGQAWSDDVGDALAAFDEAVARTRALALASETEGRRMLATTVLMASNHLGDRAMRAIEFNATHGRELALGIQETRRRTILLSYALAAACVLLGALGVVLVRRDTRRRLALVRSHARFQQARADELEQFAGRVAHDIRNPLSTATLALEMLGEDIDGARRPYVVRVGRSLSRAAAIVDGLLEFARAGAKPDPGACTAVREVIEDFASELRADLEGAEIDLVVEPLPPLLVACSAGVYLSLLSNLVRNAAKYMGDRPVRRITIRVTEREAIVVTEIADTGPGIAASLVPFLFEPYFRGATAGQGGLGLGLATVRKLAEGHGGAVGVTSQLGHGSTFWFELPRAGIAPEAAADEAAPELRGELSH